jgi:hypothetical protein
MVSQDQGAIVPTNLPTDRSMQSAATPPGRPPRGAAGAGRGPGGASLPGRSPQPSPSRLSSRATLVVAAVSALLVPLGCPQPGPAQSHPEALVVYNQNAGPDAADLASYYASKRGIPTDHICPVQLPTGQFATPDDLLGARKTLVETCICQLIPAASRPSPCSLANLDAVRLASPITHLAIIRGIPPRLHGTPWPNDSEEPSFDFYLAYTLYRTQDIFAPGTNGVPSSDYLTAELVAEGSAGYILSAPPLSTASYKDVAYGRIEAMDHDRTKALIDRTLAAERAGIRGNFFEEKNDSDFRFLGATTGSSGSGCTGYLSYNPFLPGTPESTWPSDTCRAATTWTSATGPDPNSTADDPIKSILPGTWMSPVPYALNAALLLGSNPNPNGQSGFNDFTTLTNWRIGGSTCTTLCSDWTDPTDQQVCTLLSTDYFHELDTRCVGVASGFVGHQVRSYPVQYYGFFPPNWSTDGTGSTAKTPPRVLTGGGWQDATFTDDRYLHLGHASIDAPDPPSCTLADGSVQPCPEEIAVNLSKRIPYASPVPVSGTRWYLVRLRYRNAASPGGTLGMTVTFDDGTTTVPKVLGVSLDQEHLDWTEATLLLTVDDTELATVSAVTFAFTTTLDDQATGFLDLDGVELVDLQDGTSLLPVDVGSFDAPSQNATHPGDWASNAIDRLGAVAFFGSSSHFNSSGYAFSDEGRFYGAFLMGRTLGESLLLMAGGESGIIYGDPLYRPAAVRIHIPGQGGYGKAPGLTVGPADTALHQVQLEVLDGYNNQDVTNWSLESCPTLDPIACDGSWVVRASGQGAVSGLPVDWTAFLSDPAVAQSLLLRLRVWNPGQEAWELRHYAYFQWMP